MPGVTYDTGALIAAERNDRRMWILHQGFVDHEVVPTVPAPVLAEAWRGGSRQANLIRMLVGCRTEEMSAEQARRVGELAGKARHDDVVDVAVVEGAARRADDVILTSNETHIRQVVKASGRKIRVEPV